MILKNTGKSAITYNDQGAIGTAHPGTNFQVSDHTGRYLKKLYPKQIENLEDAVKKFKESQAGAPFKAEVVVAKKTAHQIMLEEAAAAKEEPKAVKEPEAKPEAPAPAAPAKAEHKPEPKPLPEEKEGDDGDGEPEMSEQEKADMAKLEELTKPEEKEGAKNKRK